jgi:hypothetical protein
LLSKPINIADSKPFETTTPGFCAPMQCNAGCPVYCTGRDMRLSRKGMKISESDWSIFLGHAGDTMTTLIVPKQECDDVVAFVLSHQKTSI